LAAAKSIAWASGIGLVGVPSFEALAWDVQRKEKGERRKEKDGSGRGAHEVGQESGVRRKDEGRRTKDEDGTAACGGPAGAAPVPSSSFPHPSSLPSAAVPSSSFIPHPSSLPSAAVPSSSFPHPSSLPSAAGPRFVLPVRSAYSEGLYAALFAATGEGLERLMEDCVVRPEELAARVARALEARGRGEGTVAARAQVVLCGETSCLEALRHQAQAEGWRVLEGHDEITAGALAECAWRRLLAGQLWRTAAQIHSAAPLYLRASDPELKLRRRSGA
jgi:hypothetical protein